MFLLYPSLLSAMGWAIHIKDSQTEVSLTVGAQKASNASSPTAKSAAADSSAGNLEAASGPTSMWNFQSEHEKGLMVAFVVVAL